VAKVSEVLLTKIKSKQQKKNEFFDAHPAGSVSGVSGMSGVVFSLVTFADLPWQVSHQNSGEAKERSVTSRRATPGQRAVVKHRPQAKSPSIPLFQRGKLGSSMCAFGG
jgi:hypothetical protein